jgi:hypothetical protein
VSEEQTGPCLRYTLCFMNAGTEAPVCVRFHIAHNPPEPMLQRSTPVRHLSILALFAATAMACQAPAPAAPAGTPALAAEGTAAAPPNAEAAAVGEASSAPAEVASHSIETTVDSVDGRRYLVARITPGEGYHCNMEYPAWAVNVGADAPAAAGVRQGKDDATEFTENAVTFRIPLDSPDAAGTVEANVRLSVCDDEACLTPRETIAWTLASVAP